MNDLKNDIKVSIISFAYNHEKYVEQMLKNCLNQKTDFEYEIVIHDDCSTDRTTQIIREYEKKYPQIVHPIYEEENQYSKGTDIFSLCLKASKGKYIAICEGDDYWIDTEKLQMQFDTMESHPDVDMCATNAQERTEDILTQEIRPKKSDGVLTTPEVILGGGRYLATATLFFRRELFGPDRIMPFEKVILFDYVFQIKGSLKGGIYYLDRPTAVYRRATENSWTVRIERNREERMKHQEIEKRMLRQLDADTGGRFHECIEQRLQAYVPFADQMMGHCEEINEELGTANADLYLWGMGLRGEAIEEYCELNKIVLTGVCDKKNSMVGTKTLFGNDVMSTDEVLRKSKIILASNDVIADAIQESGYHGRVIRMQKYMQLS